MANEKGHDYPLFSCSASPAQCTWQASVIDSLKVSGKLKMGTRQRLSLLSLSGSALYKLILRSIGTLTTEHTTYEHHAATKANHNSIHVSSGSKLSSTHV